MTTTYRILLILLLGLHVPLAILLSEKRSEDLFSIWLAAVSLDGDRPGDVYAASGPFYIWNDLQARADMAVMGPGAAVVPTTQPGIWRSLQTAFLPSGPSPAVAAAAALPRHLLFLACETAAASAGSRCLDVATPVLSGHRELWRATRLILLFGCSRSELLVGRMCRNQGEMFTLQVPASWPATARLAGHDNALFPYVYPPLVAAVIAPVTRAIGWDRFRQAATAANLALMLGCSLLAWRILGRPMSLMTFLLLGQLALHGTSVGFHAMVQNQAQILVAFLTMLAFERSRAGAQAAAGAALACAAAIKAYPAVLVLLLIARRQYLASLSFVVAGIALAAISVAMTGWPLHSDFLAVLARIARTALDVDVSFGIFTNLIGSWPGVTLVPTPVVDPDGSNGPIYASLRPEGLAAIGHAGTAAVLAGAFALSRIASPNCFYASVLPATLVAVSLFAPLAWTYHFIAPVAFAPALMSGRRPGWGLGLFLACLLPISLVLNILAPIYLPDATGLLQDRSLLGMVAMLFLTAGFLFPAWQDIRAPQS